MRVNLLKGDINMICPILPPPPARLNLEESELIRNVLKSQRREERGDHTVLMNRDGGISSNLRLHLHLIYPSCIHQPPPPPLHPPTSPFHLSLFPLGKLCFPFRPLLSLSRYLPFSPSYKFLDCLVFISNFPLPPPPKPPLEPPPTPSTRR